MSKKKDWFDDHLIIDGLDKKTAALLKNKIKQQVAEKFSKAEKRKKER